VLVEQSPDTNNPGEKAIYIALRWVTATLQKEGLVETGASVNTASRATDAPKKAVVEPSQKQPNRRKTSLPESKDLPAGTATP